jgi:hypothetical protein
VAISQKKTYKRPTSIWKNPISLIIRQMQTETTVRYNFASKRMTINQKKKQKITSARGCGEKGILVLCW